VRACFDKRAEIIRGRRAVHEINAALTHIRKARLMKRRRQSPPANSRLDETIASDASRALAPCHYNFSWEDGSAANGFASRALDGKPGQSVPVRVRAVHPLVASSHVAGEYIAHQANDLLAVMFFGLYYIEFIC
jgi:hypothetical protein